MGEGLGAVGAPSPEEHPRSASVVRIGNANLKTASYSQTARPVSWQSSGPIAELANCS
jgi:hypothetical protein